MVVLSLPFLLMAAYHVSPEMARMCPMCAAMMPVGPFFGILFAVGIVGVLLALVLMLAASIRTKASRTPTIPTAKRIPKNGPTGIMAAHIGHIRAISGETW